MNFKKLQQLYIETIRENERLKLENEELRKILTAEGKTTVKVIKEKVSVFDLLDRVVCCGEKHKEKRKKVKKNPKIVETKEYKQFRKTILERDNYRCTQCGSNFRLQVHHIKSKKEYPELIMCPDNCITLCLVCHSKTDNFFNG